jgi:galactose mutarotase-like enzyme
MQYTLQNKYIKIVVDTLGAELKSLIKLNNHLEYIWQGNPSFWKRSAPVLFPIVGRLKEDSYIYNDTKYSMSQHGFARDMEFVLTKKEEDTLTFTLHSNKKTLIFYPFSFELDIIYKLIDSKVQIEYKIINKTDTTMYFSIGAHPAFNTPLVDDKKDDYYFLFDNLEKTKRYFLNNNGLVYEDKTFLLENNRLDITKELFSNDALIFNDAQILCITLASKKHKEFIKVEFHGFDYLGLWSKSADAPFVCIEPWHGIADFSTTSQNIKEKQGIKVLQANGIFESKYSIEV